MDAETQGEYHVITEAQIVMIQLQAKEPQGLWPPLEAKKGQERTLSRVSEGASMALLTP